MSSPRRSTTHRLKLALCAPSPTVISRSILPVLSVQRSTGSPQELHPFSPTEWGSPSIRIQISVSTRRTVILPTARRITALPSQNLHAGSSTSPRTCRCLSKVLYGQHPSHWPRPRSPTLDHASPSPTARDSDLHSSVYSVLGEPNRSFSSLQTERKTHCGLRPHKVHHCPPADQLIRFLVSFQSRRARHPPQVNLQSRTSTFRHSRTSRFP